MQLPISRLDRSLWPLALLVAVLFGAPACVDLGPFSTIRASYDDQCRRVAVVWREQFDGTLHSETVSCESIVGDSEADPELLKACEFDGLAPCEGGDVGPETVSDVPVDIPADVPVDAPVEVDGALEVGPEADGGTEVSPDADVFGEVSPDADVFGEVSPDADVFEEVSPDADVFEEVSPDADVLEDVPNVAPVLATPTAEVIEISESGGQFFARAVVGQSLSISFLAADSNTASLVQTTVAVTGGTLTPAEAGFVESFPFAPAEGAAPHTVSLTGTALVVGTLELTVTADDGAGGVDSLVLSLDIKSAPSVGVPTMVGNGKLLGTHPSYVYRIAPGEAFEVTFSGEDPSSAPLTPAMELVEGTLDSTELGLAPVLPATGPAGPSPQTIQLTGTTTVPGYAVLRFSVEDDIGGAAAIDVRVVVMGEGVDFNGDGLADFAVGGPDESGTTPGMAAIVFGRTATGSLPGPDVVIAGENNGDSFGASMVHGDFDSDGFDDLVVGAPQSQTWAVNGGVVYLFRGGLNMPATLTVADAEAVIAGSTEQGLGIAVAAADYSGDGLLDLAIGSAEDVEDDGAVRILFGPISTGAVALLADITISGGAEGFGSQISFGDVDGNGTLDLAVSAPQHGIVVAATGAVFVFTGGQSPQSFTDADVVIGGSGVASNAGHALQINHDVSGDGIDDIVFSDKGGSPVSKRIGGVFFGSDSLPSSVSSTEADALVFGGVKGDFRLYVGPDLNGDGLADLLGSTRFANVPTIGLFHGATPTLAASWIDSGLDFGGIGDFDGDGVNDLVVSGGGSARVFGGGAAMAIGVTPDAAKLMIPAPSGAPTNFGVVQTRP